AVQRVTRRLLRVAEDAVVEFLGGNAGALDRRFARNRAELLRGEVAQFAAIAAHGRARARDDRYFLRLQHDSTTLPAPRGGTKLFSLAAWRSLRNQWSDSPVPGSYLYCLPLKNSMDCISPASSTTNTVRGFFFMLPGCVHSRSNGRLMSAYFAFGVAERQLWMMSRTRSRSGSFDANCRVTLGSPQPK